MLLECPNEDQESPVADDGTDEPYPDDADEDKDYPSKH